MGLYYWARTGCSGKHASVYLFVEVKNDNVPGFISTLRYIDNLPIAHVLYAFNKEDGNVVLIEHNNTIYMGDDMINLLANSIQCEDNYLIINLRPKVYDTNNNNAL